MIVETESLTKDYPGLRALENLSLSLEGGAIGLLGPNGAGKSTLIRILMGLLKPTSGCARLLGIDTSRDPIRARQQVGYMPEHDCFIPGATAVEYVLLAGRLVGMPRRDAMQRAHMVLNYVGLHEERYRPVDTYSTGMKQKAKLAQALVHHPKLVLLDEPTSGLDPRAREEMLGLIRDLARRDVTVMLSTHILHDVERVCDTVAILHQGRLLRQGQLKSLFEVTGRSLAVRIKGSADDFVAAATAESLHAIPQADGTILVECEQADTTAILRAAIRSGVQLRTLAPRRTSLDEFFEKTILGTD